MKFRVKDMDIATGGILVALLHKKDAKLMDLHSGERILLKKGSKSIACILDIYEGNKSLLPGKIGLFEEVLKRLDVRRGTEIEVSFSGKPESVKHIREKLYGKRLDYKEIYHIIDDITNDRLTDIEKTYFVSAGFINGWSRDETVDMTRAMVETGYKMKFKGTTLDKHCIGGVPGNRTTMIVIPILAAAGFKVPKTSSRAITSPAGTADTMECLADVELSEKKIKQIIKKVGACIVHGGSMNLAPADDKIIEVEHPLSIDAEGQLLASVMAKKYSVSANHVLIDIPVGKDVKVKNWKQAKKLKHKFEWLGKQLKMNVKVIVTDGSHPIGNGIGPVLESQDVLAVLKRDILSPLDLRKKSLYLAGVMLEMAGKCKKGKGYNFAAEILDNGKAYQKMQEIISAQGKRRWPKMGKFVYHVEAHKIGHVKEINNKIIAKIARIAGAPVDKGAGIYLSKKVDDIVREKDLLYTVYAENKVKLGMALEYLKESNGYLIK
jgi:putative thymidine phosphorylase